jgi:hypothetical protein
MLGQKLLKYALPIANPRDAAVRQAVMLTSQAMGKGRRNPVRIWEEK